MIDFFYSFSFHILNIETVAFYHKYKRGLIKKVQKVKIYFQNLRLQKVVELRDKSKTQELYCQIYVVQLSVVIFTIFHTESAATCSFNGNT